MTDPHAVAAAVRPETRLIWIETPSNPALAVTDIAARRRDRARGGRALRLRQHLGHARAPAPARARLRRS